MMLLRWTTSPVKTSSRERARSVTTIREKIAGGTMLISTSASNQVRILALKPHMPASLQLSSDDAQACQREPGRRHADTRTWNEVYGDFRLYNWASSNSEPITTL